METIEIEVEEKAPATATYHQKVNIKRCCPTALIGIARKLAFPGMTKDAQRRERIVIGETGRDKEQQYFYAVINRVEVLISASRHNNVWVLSRG